MAIKTISQTTYDIELTEIKNMLIKELGLNISDNIEVQYNIGVEHHGDQRDSWTTNKVTKVTVVVKPNSSKYL